MFAGTVGDQGRLANDGFFSNRHGLQPVRDAEAQTKAICEALMQRLLPALSSIVVEVVANATARVLQEKGVVRSGVTELGPLQPGKVISIDWTFTNSGEPWPVGAKLRFLGGNLAHASTFVAASSKVVTLKGGNLVVEAMMTAPLDDGSCEACWQLEDKEGNPLSPQLVSSWVRVCPRMLLDRVR